MLPAGLAPPAGSLKAYMPSLFLIAFVNLLHYTRRPPGSQGENFDAIHRKHTENYEWYTKNLHTSRKNRIQVPLSVPLGESKTGKRLCKLP